MKEIFLERAKENLDAAELLFEKGLFNASVNRAYYSSFHLGTAAIFWSGITPTMDHRVVQNLFADNFCNKRKMLSSKYKSLLPVMQNHRNNADYKGGVSKKEAKQQLKDAKEFFENLIEVIK
jgi:uncharacterized protein (UPF0332 family)